MGFVNILFRPFMAVFLLLSAESCVMLESGKNYLSALPVTVDGQPLHSGGDFLPSPMKGGGAHVDIFGAVSVLSGYHRHLQPVFTGT